MARQPGDKLGPRLSQLFLQHQLALRRQLAPIESKIAAAGTQEVIDRAGREFATIWGPFADAALKAGGPAMPPLMQEHFNRITSGEHQWEAIAGSVQMAGTSALSSVLSNYLFPATSALNSVFRQLPVDTQTAAQAVAAGLADMGQGQDTAGAWGNTADAFTIMYQLSQQVPSPPQIYQLVNRGLISEANAVQWLTRNAIPPDLIAATLALRMQILAPADAALAVLRGNMSQADGYAVAAANGVDNATFDILTGNTGEPPALEEMLMLHRRHLMDTPTLETGIRQSRVRDEWIPYLLELEIEPPSPADVLEALVQGEISSDEALTRYTAAGGDPTFFETAYRTRANSPAPGELAEMANRGIIPWDGQGPDATTFAQGFVEGHWKDKWLTSFRDLAVYLPPPREIATLVKEGGINQDDAVKLWEQHGLSPDMAQIYWNAAHYQKTTAIHALAQGEIIKLYTDGETTRDEALSMLESVNWTKTDANWLLDIADVGEARKMLDAAVTKIRSLYVAYKLDATAARKSLSDLSVAASAADKYISIWDIERTSAPKLLTAAQIADAVYYQLMAADEAMSQLEALGYTARDAWYVIAIRLHGPIPDIPIPG